MRFDRPDTETTDREADPTASPAIPLDAAESAWDPWLWALYLREIADHNGRVLH